MTRNRPKYPVWILFLITVVSIDPATAEECLQGNHIKTSKNRPVASFNAIDIRGAFDVSIQNTPQQKVTITADQNLLPFIQTKVVEGILHISAKRSICTRLPLQVDLFANGIQKIKSSGANDIRYTGIQADTLLVEVKDAGEIQLSGKARTLIASLKDAADMEAENLAAEAIQIKVTESAEATVHVKDKLDVVITDAGSVTYHGSPRAIKKKIAEVGELLKE